jgi:quercetin dioxygenase-like cupin family protein
MEDAMHTTLRTQSDMPTILANSRSIPISLATAAAVLTLALTGAGASEDHTVLTPGEIEWTPGPPSIPDGSEAAVLYGDPGKDELFALRLRLPAGYHLPPHTHPRPEVVTVISGAFHVGMGDEAARDNLQTLESGSFFAFEPGMAHFAYTEEETVIQLNSIGPWSIEYVHSEDDPRS